MDTNNPYLRLISGSEIISIPACAGGENVNIYNSQKTFTGYIDPNFKQCDGSTSQPAIRVGVYEMYNKSPNFKTLYSSLNTDLKSLAFKSQEQIVKFVQENKQQWLTKDGYGTFFLFTEKVNNQEKFFIAFTRFFRSGELGVYKRNFSIEYDWNANFTIRFVIPIRKSLDTQN